MFDHLDDPNPPEYNSFQVNRRAERLVRRRQRRLAFTSAAVVIAVVAGFLADRGTTGSTSDRSERATAGGVSVVLRPLAHGDSTQLEEAAVIIGHRLSGLGLSASDVSVRHDDLVLSLPRSQDSQPVIGALTATAQLLFRPVYCVIPAYSPPTSSSSPTDAARYSGPADTSAALISSSSETTQGESDCSTPDAATLPSTPASQDVKTATVILPVAPKAFPSDPTIRYVLGPADMTGSAISDASAQLDTTTDQYEVTFTLNSPGAVQFDEIAAARYACYEQDATSPPVCSLEAFELDGVVESAPDFQASSFNGNVSISGDFTQSQASALADELKYGSLPVPFVVKSGQTPDP